MTKCCGAIVPVAVQSRAQIMAHFAVSVAERSSGNSMASSLIRTTLAAVVSLALSSLGVRAQTSSLSLTRSPELSQQLRWRYDSGSDRLATHAPCRRGSAAIATFFQQSGAEDCFYLRRPARTWPPPSRRITHGSDFKDHCRPASGAFAPDVRLRQCGSSGRAARACGSSRRLAGGGQSARESHMVAHESGATFAGRIRAGDPSRRAYVRKTDEGRRLALVSLSLSCRRGDSRKERSIAQVSSRAWLQGCGGHDEFRRLSLERTVRALQNQGQCCRSEDARIKLSHGSGRKH